MKQYNLEEKIRIKKTLRKSGITLLVIGLLLMVVAMVDLFLSDIPQVFYLFFIGGLFLFIGLVMTFYGYMGAVARYQASEIAPVAKDTINYMLDGTKDSAGKFFEQLKNTPLPSKTCPQCGKELFPDAMYCDNCGCAMFKKCPDCMELNEVSSKFCKSCGNQFRT
ncbi:MAG: zinc ribbon domain-containing protein [Tenericutes bacterium]|nr:zinc ribbon domain-containing protein [Mycoplasmatota bacterium]